ncbi:hypothetical protein BZG01_16790 [Labilibaculum manganireducens]|uniref:Uncharacterized protein n=1 Tax=Labilibaculum manganireducens TaxID=1940525 RepID=A0A2N3HY29_9BACT|nr:hypothetical protein BZG01_16790 [Labilibaculum manganireducens]
MQCPYPIQQKHEDLGKCALSKLTPDMAKNVGFFLIKDNRKDLACKIHTSMQDPYKHTMSLPHNHK